MKTAVVARAHQIPDRLPVQLEVGDQVQVGRRDDEWPEFVFVSASQGVGWVPARYLSTDSGSAVVMKPYDTTELPTQIGDVVEVVAEDARSGWVWCRANTGREGWVPVNTLEMPA